MAEKVVETFVEEELRQSYIDYAMSVIIGRAIPDVRDGLKPVHRRILYAMRNLGLYHDRPFKKCATVIGEVIGKYHPHGDMAVYDALTRMAQDFSLRYPLIQGQGNFGSIDGDSPAAYRYTECRLNRFGELMLEDIEKECVDFRPNFDGTTEEPEVLPSKIPNLLINGAEGIAVGMTTSIPPHNLSEVIDAVCALIDNPKEENLMKYIKGPDFPTGGRIVGIKGIKELYEKGTGRISIEGIAEFIALKDGRKAIIIKEIPYQVNKAALVERIANLVKEDRIRGIKDIRDESDKTGIRVIIELEHGVNPEPVLNQIYEYTPLRVSYFATMVAIKDNAPKLFSLKELLQEFIEHRYKVYRRKCEYELRQAEERAHIVEGLRRALDKIDLVIKIIRSAEDDEKAKKELIKALILTEKQAEAILQMRLRRLTRLERGKLEEEYLNLIKTISRLKTLLASRKAILQEIKKELLEIKEKYGDERRTKIVEEELEKFTKKDLIQKEDVILTLTDAGIIRRFSLKRLPKRISLKNEKIILCSTSNTHSDVLLLSQDGRCFRLKAYDFPESDKGKVLKSKIGLKSPVCTIIEVGEEHFLALASFYDKKKLVRMKKISAKEIEKLQKSGLKLLSKNEILTAGTLIVNEPVIIVTEKGRVGKIPHEKIPVIERNKVGEEVVRLHDDKIKFMFPAKDKNSYLILIRADGNGKGIPSKSIDRPKIVLTGEPVCAQIISPKQKLLVITEKGKIYEKNLSDIEIDKELKKSKGEKIVAPDKGDKICGLIPLS